MYNIGLDLGSNSVGWALLDDDMRLVKKNGKTLWGVRMFEDAEDASGRRNNRSSRRRLEKRNFRLELLKEIFTKEITSIDPTFFERMEDSFFKREDKRNSNCVDLFTNITDREFYNHFPTIFHLRDYLVKCDSKVDIRYIYLAIHNIVKYRGHFLMPGEDFSKKDNSQIQEIFESINVALGNLCEENPDEEDYLQKATLDKNTFTKLGEILISTDGKKAKKEALKKLFCVDNKTLFNEIIITLLVGSECDLSKIKLVADSNYESIKLSTDSDNYVNDILENAGKMPELNYLFDILPKVKDVCDHFYMLKLLSDSNTLSEAMIKQYDIHQNDLKELKRFIKLYIPSKYNECFRKKSDKLNNYPKYVGRNDISGKMERFSHCSRDEFYKYLRGLFSSIKNDNLKEKVNYFLNKMESNDFLAKQRSDQNGAIPMQLHLQELKTILNNQSKYYPFLMEKDEDGLTNIDKIVSIFKFKIPYYVGPLNTKSDKAWVVRSNDKIYPWNLEKVVNMDETAKRFIERMQNKCSYLKGADDYCLPKQSIIFSEYNVYSYLNKLSINGGLIDNDVKEGIFKNVFLKKAKPTRKDIYEYLSSNYGTFTLTTSKLKEIPEVNCDMSSYIKFKTIFGDKFESSIDLIENIIRDIVIFEDKSRLEKRLKEVYGLEKEIIKKIKDLNYKGYSNLSKRFINGLEMVDEETGEVYGTLLDVMRSTNLNLQEILYHEKYRYIDVVDKYNKNFEIDLNQSIEDFIDENISVSPLYKRPLIQAYKLIDEIEQIIGAKIDKFYIECTRTNKAEKKKTNSRYDTVKDLYKSCKSIAQQFNIDLNDLNEKLDANKDKLKSDMIYLYFTQLGRSMYSLKPIDFDDIFIDNKLDIDHIYPQSIIKDDSLSNRVLVYKKENENKKDKFTFEVDNLLDKNAYQFYEKLLEMSLITKEKYKRLTKKEISEDELSGFVNRQLVTTNQAVKGLIDTLKLLKQVPEKNIIYSKAENISDFRNEYNIYKSRTANNFHHAHDAYLNVIIGGVLNKYYNAYSFRNFKDYYRLKSDNISINPKTILSKDRVLNGKVIWNKGLMLKQIENDIFNRFDIMETVRAYNPNAMMSQVSIMPAGQGKIPVKTTTKAKDINKYGGIRQSAYSRYVIISKTGKKGNIDYILEPIPRMNDEPSNETIAREKINKYLSEIYPNGFNVEHYNIKTNVVVKDGKREYYITGNTSGGVYIKNKYDRIFSKEQIRIIHDIDKYLFDLKNGTAKESNDDIVVVSINNKNSCTRNISKTELIDLIRDISIKFGKDIYSYSIIHTIKDAIDIKDLTELSILELINLSSELLLLLKTNERKTADLKLIGMGPTSGVLKINLVLKPGMKFISESITGYYKKILFEVPR